jgi:hypothetical protein
MSEVQMSYQEPFVLRSVITEETFVRVHILLAPKLQLEYLRRRMLPQHVQPQLTRYVVPQETKMARGSAKTVHVSPNQLLLPPSSVLLSPPSTLILVVAAVIDQFYNGGRALEAAKATAVLLHQVQRIHGRLSIFVLVGDVSVKQHPQGSGKFAQFAL